MKYESLITFGLKVIAKVKGFFSKVGQNTSSPFSYFKVNVTRSKFMVPCERSCHTEHTYEI